jgi:hypothetical protein
MSDGKGESVISTPLRTGIGMLGGMGIAAVFENLPN